MSMPFLRSVTPAIDIYIRLAQYPILCDKIRIRMREELYRRGIVTPETFEQEVKKLAIESQLREGLDDPFGQEEASMWQKRIDRIRDYHTDAYFANNLGSVLLERLINDVLSEQPEPTDSIELTFNPEIAPWELLFRQGEIYERMPPEQQEKVKHHLEEIKVVLIKRMISDQLPYIGIAKHVFTIADLRYIYERRIGNGKIGGKAAGVMLAYKILCQPGDSPDEDIHEQVSMPDSYFVGTEVIYEFHLMNNLVPYMNQKYRTFEEIQAEYPAIVDAHLKGKMPDDIVEQLQMVLEEMGDSPIIVRSSSLLEDSFGTAFAGKYDSYFCPNQGTPEENLEALQNAIKRVFACTLNPDALLYRQQNGMIDYDERMGILIQRVEGRRYGRYFMPTLAGVGFSKNPFRWHPKIQRSDGFLRLVWGMGTRAVDRVDNDYPRMIALSHPQLRPETTAKAIRQYSQWSVDVLDLETNQFTTVPVTELLNINYPFLRQIASVDKGEYLQKLLSVGSLSEDEHFVLTFDTLLQDKKFVHLMKTALKRLEKAYGTPVDIEYTVDIEQQYPKTNYRLTLVQCRPLSQRREEQKVEIPANIPDEKVLFTANRLVPDGCALNIRYVIFVDPHNYHDMADQQVKMELGRAIGRLNKRLEKERFVLMGPGRWGSANIDLGVHVTYADIFNTKVLIEIAIAKDGHMPELSYGTHFFQDLVESGIHSLALHVDDKNNTVFNWDFFLNSPNVLRLISPEDAHLEPFLRVIDVPAVTNLEVLNVLMDGSTETAVGYLTPGKDIKTDYAIGTVSNF
jgi:hypothetical protein